MTDHTTPTRQPPGAAREIADNLQATIQQTRANRLAAAKRALNESRRRARQARGRDDRPVRAETQVMVDGQPVTVSELAAQARRRGMSGEVTSS